MAVWTGAEIKALRERLGESQTAFAARFGLDQSTISLWEAGNTIPRGPSVKLLDQIAVAAPEPSEAAA